MNNEVLAGGGGWRGVFQFVDYGGITVLERFWALEQTLLKAKQFKGKKNLKGSITFHIWLGSFIERILQDPYKFTTPNPRKWLVSAIRQTYCHTLLASVSDPHEELRPGSASESGSRNQMLDK
jgi:hypothetical protein